MNKDHSLSSWINHFEIWILGATALIAIFITLLDFVGALDSIPWLRDRIPVLVLLFVGLIATYIVLERRNQLQTMHQDLLDKTENILKVQTSSTESIINALQGVKVKNFESDAACLEYINMRVAQAKRQVDDISWSAEEKITPGLDRTKPLDNEYREVLSRLTQKIPFREIFIFHDKSERIQKLRNRVSDNWPGYSCVYFEDTEIPLFQFMIIDQEEVIILSALPNVRNLSIRHPDIVRLFVEYYELLWQNGRKLKIGKTIYWKEVEKILTKAKTASL